MQKVPFSLLVLACTLNFASCKEESSQTIAPEEDSSQFVLLTDVVPDAILEIRYYSTYNFIGKRIPGYEAPVAILTRQAADSLLKVSEDLKKDGYRLKIFDAYRPQKAVDCFMEWAEDLNDTLMKSCFYPELEKPRIIPEDYVCRKSSHTRGSTVDLTLFDVSTQKEVDMGSPFDYFGLMSHPDVQPGQQADGYPSVLTEQQYENRMILRRAMLAHGFLPFTSEWWHFTLNNEPFPDTYFTFPVTACLPL